MSEPELEHAPEGHEPEPIPHWPPSLSMVMDNNDTLAVVLRRLPPRPSSLPHASLVSWRWRNLTTSEAFLRDFRAFHRASPVLGLFHNTYVGGADRRFVAAVDPPDRVPASLFRVPCGRDHRNWRFLDCRHGRALLIGPVGPSREVLVWDPMTAARRRAPLPPDARDVSLGAVVCSCNHEGDCQSSHFQVVLVWFNPGPMTHGTERAVASVYSSESGTWSNIITRTAPFVYTVCSATKRGTLAGNSVYWLIPGTTILEFDVVTRNLAVISMPTETPTSLYRHCQLVLTEAKELGLAMVIGGSIKLWKRDNTNASGWSMYRSFQLDGFLPPRKAMQKLPSLLGFHEETNAIFVWIEAGVFMIQLESMQARLLCQGFTYFEIYPFAGFYSRDVIAGAQGDGDVDERRLPIAFLNIWHYEDPGGNVQGPFTMMALWQRSTQDLRVWRTDETKEQAVLLTDAMHLRA